MIQMSEPIVNCPSCGEKPFIFTRDDGIKCACCSNTSCDFWGPEFTIFQWNTLLKKLFEPKEIDWEEEKEKFNKWFCDPGKIIGCYEAWCAALENRDDSEPSELPVM